jgi:hypothetical protein
MLPPLHAQDHIVAGQIDLHHYMPLRHNLQQVERAVLVHHVHAVADPLRARYLDRLPYVEVQAFGRHQPGRELARMQRHRHVRVQGTQRRDHLHVQRIVRHRVLGILRLYQVDPDVMRMR